MLVCLLATGLCKTHRRWRGLRRTRVVARSWPFRGLLQECAMRALVRCRQPRRAAAAQAHCTMCVCVEYPRRRVLPASRAPISDPIPHKRMAVAEAVIDIIGAVAAARGARCRDARARAACTSGRRGRRLHGAGRGTRHAAIAAARDDCRGGGCAGLCRPVRGSKAVARPHWSGRRRCAARGPTRRRPLHRTAPLGSDTVAAAHLAEGPVIKCALGSSA